MLKSRHSTKSWKKPTDVASLRVTQTEIGQGDYGRVLKGKIRFRSSSGLSNPIPVAVKKFRIPLSASRMHAYERVIEKLQKTKAPLLKVGFMEHEGTQVQVMRLFADTKGSKVEQFFEGTQGRVVNRSLFAKLRNPKNRNQLFDTLASIVNAGYHIPKDAIGAIPRKSGPYFVVFDLDVFGTLEERGASPQTRQLVIQASLAEWMSRISTATDLSDRAVFDALNSRITSSLGKSSMHVLERYLPE